jgi:hypothetical protein
MSQSRKSIQAWLAPAALLAAISCGPGRSEKLPVAMTPEGREFAEAVCAARQSCGCADGRFETAEQCENDLALAFDSAAQGLTLDAECFDEALASEALNACPVWPWIPEGEPCLVLSGSKNEGETCETHSDLRPIFVSDCKEGLFCSGGSCRTESPPTERLQTGDHCFQDPGCGDLDLYCGSDSRCHPRSPVGESCNHDLACDGSYCKMQSGVCSARVEPGGACDPKDWGACDSPDFPSEIYWCGPDQTCVVGQPAVCRMTHPVWAEG